MKIIFLVSGDVLTVVNQLRLFAWVDLDTRCGREPVALQHKVVVQRENAVEEAALVKLASPVIVSFFAPSREKTTGRNSLVEQRVDTNSRPALKRLAPKLGVVAGHAVDLFAQGFGVFLVQEAVEHDVAILQDSFNVCPLDRVFRQWLGGADEAEELVEVC